MRDVAARSTVGKCGTRLMIGCEESSGAAMGNTRLKVKKVVKAGISTIMFYTRHLWVHLMLWLEIRSILLESGKNALRAMMR